MTDELNRRFAIPDHISFGEGVGGMPKVRLVSGTGSSAEIYLFGASLTSWSVPGVGELLFLSSRSDLTGASAIRGGVPLVFPQFGRGDNTLPPHGFARISHWSVCSAAMQDGGEVALSLRLSDSEATRAIWPYRFSAQLSVTLGQMLRMTFTCENTGDCEFPFQMAYHTYFSIGDIDSCSVSGLSGLTYLDSTNNRNEVLERSEKLCFDQEVDRIYCQAPNSLLINAPARGISIKVDKEGLSDAVVWNPWIQRSKAITDLGDQEYCTFLCVEAGTVAKPIALAKGESWQGSQTLSVSASS